GSKSLTYKLGTRRQHGPTFQTSLGDAAQMPRHGRLAGSVILGAYKQHAIATCCQRQ
ncbi:hypothetical protein SK128_005640, partial [Halocaridina rubra]